MHALRRGIARCLAVAAATLGLGTALAGAADFTQPERDAEFIKSARRQDRELLQFYGKGVPGGTAFAHMGSFRAMVHRDGMVRPLTLVPVAKMRFNDEAGIKQAARGNNLVMGALKLTYGLKDPVVVPGTILLRYDGLRVRLLDVHGTELAKCDATLGEVPSDTTLPSQLGKLGETEYSLSNILPDGTVQIFIQLADEKGKSIKGAQGLSKVLFSFQIPELVSDDGSEPVKLAVPKQEESSASGSGETGGSDDDGTPAGGHGGHHH